jgi:hypothetical protein
VGDFVGTGRRMSGSSCSSVLRARRRGTSHATLRDTEKKGGGSGAKLDGAVLSRSWAPKRDISRLGTLGRRRAHIPYGGARGGPWPERYQTGHGRKASPLVRRRRLASFTNSWLRPPMGGLKTFRFCSPLGRATPAGGSPMPCYWAKGEDFLGKSGGKS